jgi:cytochrome d ubiquinol oxidase subunit II
VPCLIRWTRPGTVTRLERTGRASSWLTPTSLIGGVLAVGTCAFLAGVFLTGDAERSEHTALTETLRRRTLAVGITTGVVVFAALVPLQLDAPTLSKGLEGRAAPLVVLSGLAGLATLLLLVRRRYGPARLTAVVAVGAVLLGWGVGQYPWLLVDQETIQQTAGAEATLVALLVAVVLAVVLVLPPLAYLFWFVQASDRKQSPADAAHVPNR